MLLEREKVAFLFDLEGISCSRVRASFDEVAFVAVQLSKRSTKTNTQLLELFKDRASMLHEANSRPERERLSRGRKVGWTSPTYLG